MAAAPHGALSHACPDKPVRMPVPFPAGAGVDIVAYIAAEAAKGAYVIKQTGSN